MLVPATQAMLKELTHGSQDTEITGVLYFTGGYAVHFLEGTSEGLFHIIGSVNHSALTNSRVLYTQKPFFSSN